MELIDGNDLSAEAPVPFRLACIHLRDIASILGLLHARRLAHRDLSPRNLLLAGAAATLLDTARVKWLAEVVEPFTALGAKHATTVTHRFIRMLGLMMQDRFSQARAEVQSLLAFLEGDTPIRRLPPPGSRRVYVAGCLFSLGVKVAWREGDEVLRIAERLDQFGPLFELNADHLRATYYARRGDLRRAEQYRQKIELYAIQLGSTWQVETWAVADLAPHAIRTKDVMLLKRVAHELARLSEKIPNLARDERYARGTYLAMRGQYACDLCEDQCLDARSLVMRVEVVHHEMNAVRDGLPS